MEDLAAISGTDQTNNGQGGQAGFEVKVTRVGELRMVFQYGHTNVDVSDGALPSTL